LRISYSYGLERLPKLHKAKKHSTDSWITQIKDRVAVYGVLSS
jgi:hypothetical protein